MAVGTVAAALLLVCVTVSPFPVAGCNSVIVPVAVLPPRTSDGLKESDEITAVDVAGTTLMTAVTPGAPYVAVRVTLTSETTVVVEILNVA